MRRTAFLALAGLALTLTACGGQQSSTDPYADPGTTPPAPITDPTVAVSFSAGEPTSDNLVTLNVPGFAPIADSLGSQAAREAFTVVEDGVVKGITVEEIGSGSRAGADIAFVLDTTGSMSYAIDSVKESIIDFADYLDSEGLDVRLGSITFGDAFDTKYADSDSLGVSINGDEPPAFDENYLYGGYERASFELSDNVAAFQEFIAQQVAWGGANSPENGLGAVAFAREGLDWRPGAQCIIIAITDAPAWTDVNPGDGIDPDSRWMPPSPEDTIADLRGECVVHVISPELYYVGDDNIDLAELTGVDATGGVHVNLRDNFDLADLPLGDVLTSGYLVTYRATVDGSEHEVRLVVDDGDSRGEITRDIVY